MTYWICQACRVARSDKPEGDVCPLCKCAVSPREVRVGITREQVDDHSQADGYSGSK